MKKTLNSNYLTICFVSQINQFELILTVHTPELDDDQYMTS